MGTLSFSGLDEIGKELSRLGEGADEIKEAMLNAGENTAVRIWRETGAQFGYNKPGKSGRGTGRMMAAISGKEAEKGVREIYPQGTRNAEVAFLLNYGHSGKGPKGGLKGSGWCDLADRRCEAECVPVMADIFYHFIETGNVPDIQVTRYTGGDGENGSGGSRKRKRKKETVSTRSTKKNQFFNPDSYWARQAKAAQHKSRRRRY